MHALAWNVATFMIGNRRQLLLLPCMCRNIKVLYVQEQAASGGQIKLIFNHSSFYGNLFY